MDVQIVVFFGERWRFAHKPVAGVPQQRAHHGQRQTLPRLAIRTRGRAVQEQLVGDPFHDVAVYRRLTGSVGVQRLRQKQRQRRGRREQPFTMCGQLPFNDVQRIGIGQHVEEVVGVNSPRTLSDTVTLRPTRSAINVHGGWRLAASWAICLGRTNSLPGRQPLFQISHLAPAARHCAA
ncbi:MAG: hypothetical protein ABI389_02350 [Rhodanobacter sp.]